MSYLYSGLQSAAIVVDMSLSSLSQEIFIENSFAVSDAIIKKAIEQGIVWGEVAVFDFHLIKSITSTGSKVQLEISLEKRKAKTM